jgi:hypothetical protein
MLRPTVRSLGGGERPSQWRFGLLQRDGAIGARGGS